MAPPKIAKMNLKFVSRLIIFTEDWATEHSEDKETARALSVFVKRLTELSDYEMSRSERRCRISSLLIYTLTARVVGAPQMISQPVSSIFPCSQLPSGTWRTPGLPIPWCCLPTSSSVCFVFFPLSLCFTKWFWPDLMNGRHDHTTAVCVSLRWSGGLRVVRVPAGSWHGLPRW